MARINHFDISALDAERAKKFYENVFGWKFEQWENEPYWMITTGKSSEPGINGGMTIREKDNYVVNTLGVKSIDKAISDIRENGGNITVEKSPIPGYGYWAHFKDPDGNLLALMEENPNAQ